MLQVRAFFIEILNGICMIYLILMLIVFPSFSEVNPVPLEEDFCLLETITSFATVEGVLIRFYYQIGYVWGCLKLTEIPPMNIILLVEEQLSEMLMQSFYEECKSNQSEYGSGIHSVFLEGISSSPFDIPIQGVYIH